MKNKSLAVSFILSLFLSGLGLAQSEPPQGRPQEPAGGEKAVTKASTPGKISIDIKGMDILDVFKMLSARSGMNIIVGKNVTGRVTMFLKEVDINDAFEIIILANDLAYEKKGGIINVMTQRDYELLYGERFQDKKQAMSIQLKYAKATDLSRALTQIKTNIGRIVVDEGSNTLMLIDTPGKLKEMADFIQKTDLPLETRVFGLNYATVDKLSVKIQETLTKNIGILKIDERTNKFVVTDYPAKLNEIATIVSAFDEKTPQVLIDAQIIEITPKDTFQMGVDWNSWLKNQFKLSAALPSSTKGGLIMGTPDVTPTAKDDYKAIIDILRTVGDTKVLSSPRIMALNNQEAKILVGTKDAYITSSSSQAGSGAIVTSQSVNFVDVGIKLFVTPTINRDNYVTMKIRPEISSSTATSITSEDKQTDVPIVTTSEAETTVMVKDGVTIIIGGLNKNKRAKTVNKVPMLGDVPLLGVFFKNTSDTAEKIELVILLTPHIMSGEDTFTDFADIRPVNGVKLEMVNGDIVKEKISRPQGARSDTQKNSEYYRAVTSKVRTLARSNYPKEQKGLIRIRFDLSKDGTLIRQPDILETNNPVLNQYAIEAIKKSSPFAPFPDSLKKDKEIFEIALSYE